MTTDTAAQTIATLLVAARATGSDVDTIGALKAIRQLSPAEQAATLADLWEHGYELVLDGYWPTSAAWLLDRSGAAAAAL